MCAKELQFILQMQTLNSRELSAYFWKCHFRELGKFYQQFDEIGKSSIIL